MSRRYDLKTTTFTPEGRLMQVEYAINAINHAGACIAVLSKDGIVISCEKKISSKLLFSEKKAEKMYLLDNHIACAAAGITADANILIDHARLNAQRFLFTYNEPVPVEYLVRSVCNVKQGKTQMGGKRPYGVSFVTVGYDEHFGYQIYCSDPSGNYGGWKAIAIGSNNQASNAILRSDWEEGMDLEKSKMLCAKVMAKTMDSTSLTFEKLEFAILTRNKNKEVVFDILSEERVNKLLKEYEKERAKEEEEDKD